MIIRIGSTCILAAVRLNSTIIYVRSEDTTYWVCDMAFWCAGELACVLLVFCIPVCPKVFRESRMLSRILNSWPSWPIKRTKPSSTSTFVQDGHDFKGYQLPAYSRINENGESTDLIPSHFQMATLGSVPITHGNPYGAVKFPTSIVRTTTNLEVADEFENNPTTSRPHHHPAGWSGGKVLDGQHLSRDM